MKTPRQILNLEISEANFEAQIAALAQMKGWTVKAFRPGRTEKGWRTPVKYDGQGAWDLDLYRERHVVIEVKSEKRRLTPEQEHWGFVYEAAGIEYHIARPSDWEKVEVWLE